MKLVSFSSDAGPQIGVIDRDEVVLLTDQKWSGSKTIARVLAGGELPALRDHAAAATGERLQLASIRFLPAVFDPPRIFCIGVNYEEHRVETGRERSAAPIIFLRTPQSQTAHGATIRVPPDISRKIDYEGEIAVVIGKGGHMIERENAMSHLAFYSAYNDVSVRDWQTHTQQWTPGKNFDGTGAFGPFLVTPDEMPDSPEQIRLETRLNGQVMQDAYARDMIFAIDEQIAYISIFTALLPGDVIVTGTPGGVGAKRNPQIFMAAGDIIEVEVSGVGVLSNSIG